jgi:hypothetical protein
MTAEVCIVGQMIVLQAIELVAGIGNAPGGAQTVMANTDGITVKCRRHLAGTVRETMRAVADAYDLKVKETEYVRLVHRDGIGMTRPPAVKERPRCVQLRRRTEKFAERVVVDAVRAYFLHDTPWPTPSTRPTTALFVWLRCSKGWHLTEHRH